MQQAMECRTYSLHCTYRKSRVLFAVITGVFIVLILKQVHIDKHEHSVQAPKESVSERVENLAADTNKTAIRTDEYANANRKLPTIQPERLQRRRENDAMKRYGTHEQQPVESELTILYENEKKKKVKKIPFKELEKKYPLNVNMVALVSQYRKKKKIPSKPINVYQYQTIKSPSNKCPDNENQEIFLIFLIKSATANFERREVIRETWANENHMKGINVKRVFLLGLPLNNQSLSESISAENEKYRDIVQFNFQDVYYNNTLKTVGGINWVVKECSSAKFVMFVDDDFFVATDSLISYLNTIPKKEIKSLYMGYVNDKRPARRPFGDYAKWYIPYSEYAFTKYPLFVSAGAILMSMEFVKDVQVAAQFTKHFRFDDVFLGIVAFKLKVQPQQNDDFWMAKCTYTDPCFDEMLVSHDYDDPEEVRIAWKLYLEQLTWNLPSRS